MKSLSRRRKDDRGASAVEYALIIAIMGITLVAIVAGINWPLQDMVDRVGAMFGQ